MSKQRIAFSNCKTGIAYVQASWHKNIVDQAREGFRKQIQARGYSLSDVDFF